MARKHHEPATKSGPSEKTGVVATLVPDEGYGFLLVGDSREVRFTRDAVLRDEFDELRIGSEVRFEETPAETGPDATMVDLVSLPLPEEGDDETLLGAEDEMPAGLPEPPDGYQEK